MKNAICIFTLMMILTGCETIPKQYEPQKSQAQLENERIRFNLTNAQASFKTCQDEIKKSDLLIKIYQDILLENDESPNKYTHIFLYAAYLLFSRALSIQPPLA